MPTSNRTWIEINRSALLANAKALRSLISKDTLMLSVVKANAYGHGLIDIAKILAEKTDWFGVDSLDEALALRRAKIKIPILILGYTPPDRAAEIVQNDLRQIVYDLEAIGALDDAARHIGKTALVHLKIETGMGRQGIQPENLARFLAVMPEFTGVDIEGLATHLATADDINDPSFAELQLTRFHAAVDLCQNFGLVPKIRHVGSSASTMLSPHMHYDLVRVGIALYGIWPSPEIPSALLSKGKNIELKPVLSLRTKIAQINQIKAGSPVGYGLTEHVNRDSHIAVLPIGYADGYDRRLSSLGEALINGKRAKVLGVVMMNIIIVDVTDIPEVNVGGIATLIGSDGEETISVAEISQKIGTIPYETVARLNPLIPRILV